MQWYNFGVFLHSLCKKKKTIRKKLYVVLLAFRNFLISKKWLTQIKKKLHVHMVYITGINLIYANYVTHLKNLILRSFCQLWKLGCLLHVHASKWLTNFNDIFMCLKSKNKSSSFFRTVNFRYVVFRPFMDEILTGKTKSCSKEGVYGTQFP